MEATRIPCNDNDLFIDDLASFFVELHAAAPLELARALLKAAMDAHNDAVSQLEAELDAERARLRAANADLSELLAVQAAGASRSPNSALQPLRAAATPQLDDGAKAPWPSPDASPDRPIIKLRPLRSSASPARATRRVTVSSYPSPVEPDRDRGERDVRPRSALVSIGGAPQPAQHKPVNEPPARVPETGSQPSKGYADSSAIIDAYLLDSPSPKKPPPKASSRARSLTLVSDAAALGHPAVGDDAALPVPSRLSSPLEVVRRPLRDSASAPRQHQRPPASEDLPASASNRHGGSTTTDTDAPSTPPSRTTGEGEQCFWGPQSQPPPAPKANKQRPCSLQLDLLSPSSADGFEADGPLTPRPRAPASTPPSTRIADRTDELAAVHKELAAQREALATTEAALVRAWDRAEALADEHAEADAELQTVRCELAAAQHALDGERRAARREHAELRDTLSDLQATQSALQETQAELAVARFELQAARAQGDEQPTTPRRHSFAIGERASPERTRQRSMKWLGDARAAPAMAKIDEEEDDVVDLDSELAAAHECIAQLEARVERADREGRRVRAELDAAVERVAAVEKELDGVRRTIREAQDSRLACKTELESVSGVVASLQHAQRLSTEEIARERRASQVLTCRIKTLQDELLSTRRELSLRAAELDACSSVLHESYLRLIDAGRLLAEKDVQIAVLTADWLAARCDAYHADALLVTLSAGSGVGIRATQSHEH